MVNIVGIVIIILGFIAPFMSDGYAPSVIFFWVGFLMLLRPCKYISSSSKWPRYARIGLLLSVVMALVSLLCSYFIMYYPIHSNHGRILAGGLSLNITRIAYPIRALYDFILPVPYFEQPDGSISFKISFMRTSLTSIFNILFYMIISVFIGKYLRKGSPEITSQPS